MKVLVINSGSSSVKYQLRDVDADEVLQAGVVERIGQAGGQHPDHPAAIAAVTEQFEHEQVAGVGHRVVHGGEQFAAPVLIDDQVREALHGLCSLAPLHNPANVAGIEAVTQRWPRVPQVAVFDTAFHQSLPERAWRYPLPRGLYDVHRIRRYGFHGTSHGYVSARAAAFLDCETFTGIIAHIGNGASVSAIRDGRSVDTSMGFTPLEGLVMGTRCGDVDPSIPVFLTQQGYSVKQLDELLNRSSGLLALAGTSDMRDVEAAAARGEAHARMALEIATYRLAKYVGAYHVAVGGAQALVFTAGVGENSPTFRELTVQKLRALGLLLAGERNQERSGQARLISADSSAFPVLVVPTDEEGAIAQATAALLQGHDFC